MVEQYTSANDQWNGRIDLSSAYQCQWKVADIRVRSMPVCQLSHIDQNHFHLFSVRLCSHSRKLCNGVTLMPIVLRCLQAHLIVHCQKTMDFVIQMENDSIRKRRNRMHVCRLVCSISVDVNKVFTINVFIYTEFMIYRRTTCGNIIAKFSLCTRWGTRVGDGNGWGQRRSRSNRRRHWTGLIFNQSRQCALFYYILANRCCIKCKTSLTN